MNTGARHIMTYHDITFSFLCKNSGKEHVAYFNSNHNLLGQLRMYHICMTVFISVRLE